jgi:hypothetical protein
VAIVVAIVVAGATIVGAIVYVNERSQPRTVTMTSAQTAWEYTTNGWRCESDRGKPLNLELARAVRQDREGPQRREQPGQFLQGTPVTYIEPYDEPTDRALPQRPTPARAMAWRPSRRRPPLRGAI